VAVIRIEPLASTYLEVDTLILGYYADTNAQDGIPPLSMDWPAFIALEAADKLLLFTARDGDALVGVNMYLVSNHPQHGGMLCALCNTLAVTTSQRGKGIGSELTKAAVRYFSTRTEVKMVIHHFRTIYDAVPLFPKLGFDLVEHVYMKVL
jgi:GNAT superfamily N-acetyltransferase